MKVLKPGNGQTEWSIESTCTGSGNGGGGCGAVLLVGESDLFKTSSHHYDGSSEHYATYKCPCCKVKTDIPTSKVPGHIWSKMRGDPDKYSARNDPF